MSENSEPIFSVTIFNMYNRNVLFYLENLSLYTLMHRDQFVS